MSESPTTTTGAFSAADLRHRMAEREAAKAAEELRHMQEQEEKQKGSNGGVSQTIRQIADQLMQMVKQFGMGLCPQ